MPGGHRDCFCINMRCLAVPAASTASCGHMLAVGMRQQCTGNDMWPCNGWQHRCSLHAAAVWSEDAAHGSYSILGAAGR